MSVAAHELTTGWRLAQTAPDAVAGPHELGALESLPAQVPGTAASALRAAGRWPPDGTFDLDAHDWWFWTEFELPAPEPGEELWLCFDGLATVSEAYLGGERVLEGASMFAQHAIEVTSQAGTVTVLAICCRALAPRLAVRRRPRARWRTRLVAHGNLRFFRTMILGRAPGFAPGPPVVGPWRPVRLERRRGVVLEDVSLLARLEAGGEGTLGVELEVRPLPGAVLPRQATVTVAGHEQQASVTLSARPDGAGLRLAGEVRLAEARPWWPHTHGPPDLYRVELALHHDQGEEVVPLGQVGFRKLTLARELEREGLGLRINGEDVFARGAVWTPCDLADPHGTPEQIRATLEQAVGAGMNMVRVAGVACYERDEFYDLCDELGILVWQDFMFANLDYPETDAGFMEAVEAEVEQLRRRIAHRPSLAVLCGGSEIAQQVAMLGLDPGLATGPLFGEMLPHAIAGWDVEAPYLPSTPWGGSLPFRPDRGVVNYYGVGAYMRPLEDARLAGVRFAAECLAFSNIPAELPAAITPGGPEWKAGIPRDAGAAWDFEDVRDHYLEMLFDLDARQLRGVDPERYLELSGFLTGEVMAEVFGEWRRAGSPCAGALVLWLRDLAPGAGWGLLDALGQPKAALHPLRRALAPTAAWTTDEGLGGIAVHVAHDGPLPLEAQLRVAAYREGQHLTGEHVEPVSLPPRGHLSADCEALLGRFVDLSWAYRFGPPAQDLVVVSLEQPAPEQTRLLSQGFRFPAGRPTSRRSAEDLGLQAIVEPHEDGAMLVLATRCLVYGVHLHVPGHMPEDDFFSLEPGHARRVRLRRTGNGDTEGVWGGTLSALNLAGRLSLPLEAVR